MIEPIRQGEIAAFSFTKKAAAMSDAWRCIADMLRERVDIMLSERMIAVGDDEVFTVILSIGRLPMPSRIVEKDGRYVVERT